MAGAADFVGHDLGTKVVEYDERDAILYALAVGAQASELDLVFERDLRVLPTFGLALGLWGPDALGPLGAFDIGRAVHGSQLLIVRAPLPPSGKVETAARVANVWDKGRAAVFDVEVASEFFAASYTIFAPGSGGFGGQRGPSWPDTPAAAKSDRSLTVPTFAEQAALYRLTGDRHRIHIDPDAARAIGAERPILHGLCTLATCVRGIASAVGAHPADLVELSARFAGPVLPGDVLDVRSAAAGEFEAAVRGRPVLTGGLARFA